MHVCCLESVIIDYVKFDRKKHLNKIARNGGLARVRLHGNPGTTAGRILGGLNSLKTHRNLKHSPFMPHKFITPPYSINLAEFIGILLGDGGISSRQVTITLHKSDDRDYAYYVSDLILKIFNIVAVPKERKNQNVNIIVLSRTLLIEFLNSMGIRVGSKIRSQARVPSWIEDSVHYKRKCVRGLFDTDGCFYIDRHLIKGKIYKNAGMNFTNRSVPLLRFFNNTLTQMGFVPTQTSKYCVVLRKGADIVRYFGEIGSSNPKHLNKFRAYQKEKGRVPKRS